MSEAFSNIQDMDFSVRTPAAIHTAPALAFNPPALDMSGLASYDFNVRAPAELHTLLPTGSRDLPDFNVRTPADIRQTQPISDFNVRTPAEVHTMPQLNFPVTPSASLPDFNVITPAMSHVPRPTDFSLSATSLAPVTADPVELFTPSASGPYDPLDGDAGRIAISTGKVDALNAMADQAEPVIFQTIGDLLHVEGAGGIDDLAAHRARLQSKIESINDDGTRTAAARQAQAELADLF